MQGLIAGTREVCNATRRLGDGSCLILRQRVRGSVRAVRAVRNTRVFQTETGVVADVNNILKWRLTVSDTNAKNPDQLYQLIVDMEEMDGLVCGWEESSVDIEGQATPSGYQNPIAVVRYILGHPPLKDHLL